MTDKQIIIDGVDVSGCKWFTHNQLCECAIKPADDFHCHANPNCYYKQLKRKEQECEELKKIINEAKNSKLDLNSFFAIEAIVGEYQLELDQLKAENEELKRQHQGDKGLITSTGKMNYQLIQEYDKVKTALTEIKEIAEKGHKERGNLMRTWWFKEILQKISECEGNDVRS